MFVEKNSGIVNQGASEGGPADTVFSSKQKSKRGRQPRLYSNIMDCIRKSQEKSKSHMGLSGA